MSAERGDRRAADPAPALLCVRPATRGQRVVAAVLLAGVAGAAMVLARENPGAVAWMPRCPSKLLLGLECPGCGSTRAVHHLLRLDLVAAWRHNPALVLVGLPLLALFLAGLLGTLAAGRQVVLAAPRGCGIAVAAALLLYMVARNLPWPAFEPLRPPPPVAAPSPQGATIAESTTSPR